MMRAFFGWMLLFSAMVMCVVLKFIGIDMTQGQMLLAFWPWWLLVAIYAIAGAIIVSSKPASRGG
jgi:hypothetical protein